MSNDNDSDYNSDFNSVDSGFIDTDDSLPMMDALQKDNLPPKPVPFTKTKAFYGLLIGSLIALIFLAWLLISVLGGDESPATQPIAQPTAEELRQAELEEAEAALAERQPIAAPITNLPANDFTLAADPVAALATQSVEGLIREMPEYTVVGNDVITPDGRLMPTNDPYILQILDETRNMVAGYVLENRFLDSRFQDGQEAWYIRNGEGFNDEDYVPITNDVASTNLRDNMRIYAMEQLRPKIAAAPWQVRQDPVAAVVQAQPQVVINPALTEAERDRLLTMIDTQRNNNLELARENQDLREEQQEVKNKVVNLVQRLEDSPAVSAKLRATMIPESSGWKVSAIVGDRIYLINKDNITVTLSQGDKLPDSDLIISHSDESSGIVLVTPSTK